MIAQPVEQDVIKELLNKASESCDQNDFRGFMSCFTPSRASAIRKNVEHAFICDKVRIEVLDFFVISTQDQSISFGLRYMLANGNSKTLYCSKVIAKKIGDSWLIDSEQVKSMSVENQMPNYSARAENVQFEIGEEPGRPEWCPPGIGWVPGGCVGGRCGIR